MGQTTLAQRLIREFLNSLFQADKLEVALLFSLPYWIPKYTGAQGEAKVLLEFYLLTLIFHPENVNNYIILDVSLPNFCHAP